MVSRKSFTEEEAEGSIADQVGQSAGGNEDGEAGRSSREEGGGWALVFTFGGVVTGVLSMGSGILISSDAWFAGER